ncbi:MAG: occM [Gammaproteobacteria bacterium]|jgi:His/Glu/Gln/Arg/opine family amino acid ABC transporter permease subunit|nr:occM [Gammaproteobacteria bacterium]
MNDIIQHLPELISGLGVTLALMFSALVPAIILALLLTPAARSKHLWLSLPVDGFIFFMRGTPLLVQIFLIYYGSAQFEWVRASFLWVALREPFACATIALALNSCAYTIVLLKGAIQSVPREEITACYALGMSQFLTFWRITLPRAIRIILPAYSNEVVIILKSTSLANTITILDLMGVTNKIAGETYAVIPFLFIAGAIYLALNFVILSAFRSLEKRANVYLYQASQ